VLLVQLGNDGLRKKGGKENRLCSRLTIHEEAPVVEERVCNTFLPHLGLSSIQNPNLRELSGLEMGSFVLSRVSPSYTELRGE
jgi:hypothetical protein